MKTIGFAAFGWLVPGGVYLLMRRYVQFAVFAAVVTVTFVMGLLLQGGLRWPRPEELAGLDVSAALIYQAGAFAKVLAGAPYLIACGFDGTSGFLAGRLHEYGTTLLMMAGGFNLLAISSAFDLRKEQAR